MLPLTIPLTNPLAMIIGGLGGWLLFWLIVYCENIGTGYGRQRAFLFSLLVPIIIVGLAVFVVHWK